MAHISGIEEHMEVVGADGVHVGTVDKVEGDRIKLTKKDSGQGSHQGHHHYLPAGLVADVEGGKVRLSATAANALMFREEDEGTSALVTGGANSSTGAGETRTSSGSYQAQNSNADKSGYRQEGKQKSGPNWAGIALGTAAAAATAGAAIYARRQKSDKADAKKFELRLQTDETARLISSAKVEGTPVIGRDGQHLGKIDSFMVDKYTGRVAYAVLSFGGTLGIGENLFPLPWSALDYDVEQDGYRLNLTSDQLESAPKFKRSDTPEFNPQYRRTVALFYAR
jgi:hypothetical protein